MLRETYKKENQAVHPKRKTAASLQQEAPAGSPHKFAGCCRTLWAGFVWNLFIFLVSSPEDSKMPNHTNPWSHQIATIIHGQKMKQAAKSQLYITALRVINRPQEFFSVVLLMPASCSPVALEPFLCNSELAYWPFPVLYTAAMIQAHPEIPYFHTFSPIQQCPPYTSHDHPPLLLTWPLDPTYHITWLLALHRATPTWYPALDKTRPTACMLYHNKPRQRYSLAFLLLLTSQKNRTLAYNTSFLPEGKVLTMREWSAATMHSRHFSWPAESASSGGLLRVWSFASKFGSWELSVQPMGLAVARPLTYFTFCARWLVDKWTAFTCWKPHHGRTHITYLNRRLKIRDSQTVQKGQEFFTGKGTGEHPSSRIDLCIWAVSVEHALHQWKILSFVVFS